MGIEQFAEDIAKANFYDKSRYFVPGTFHVTLTKVLYGPSDKKRGEEKFVIEGVLRAKPRLIKPPENWINAPRGSDTSTLDFQEGDRVSSVMYSGNGSTAGNIKQFLSVVGPQILETFEPAWLGEKNNLITLLKAVTSIDQPCEGLELRMDATPILTKEKKEAFTALTWSVDNTNQTEEEEPSHD